MEAIIKFYDALTQFTRKARLQNTDAYHRFSILFAVLVMGIFTQSAFGQNYLIATGSPSFGTPQPVALGTVDASSGNLHLSIPLGSYPQRGTSQPEPITLEYDSNIWTPEVVVDWEQWEPSNGPAEFSYGGWYFSFLSETIPQSSGWQTNYSNCTEDVPWMDQNGTTHMFHLTTTFEVDSNCPPEASAYATDSSGYEMFVWNNNTSKMKVYAPDGALAYQYPYVQDSHGNYILSVDSNGNYLSRPQSSYYSLTDTLGRAIAVYNPTTLSTSQGTAQYQIVYASIPVKTNFQQSGIQESGTGTITVIRSLTLPDSAESTYYFTYDCDESTGNVACASPAGRSGYFGELVGITLPTGGTESYSYQIFSDAFGNKSNWVSSHSSAGGNWTYSPQVLSTCSSSQVNCKQQTTVQDPEGTTVYTYQLNNGAWPISIVRESGGSALSTVTNTWDFSQSCITINCHGNQFVRLLAQQTTVPIPSGSLTKKTQFTYDSPQYGNQTAVEEWRYIPSGNAFPSVPDRATYKSYLYYTGVNNSNYSGMNNINRPQSVTLCGNTGSSSSCTGGGSVISQTLYTYDAYGTSGLTSITGVANHDDTDFGSVYAERGNPTSMSQWVSGSKYLTTSYTYDTTGQMRTETDPALNITTNSYADNFFIDGGNGTTPIPYTPSQPTNAYVTSVSDSIGTQTTGYYFGSGSEAISTDYNGVSTYSHYQDNLNRQTEKLDPIGWELATYPSATQSDIYSAVGDTSPSTSCSSCQHTQTLLDSWGRTASKTLVNNPVGPVEVDINHNAIGEVESETHPYSGSSDPNHVFETYIYDALGRTSSVFHPDAQQIRTLYGANVTTFGGPTTQGGSTSSYGYGYPEMIVDEAGKQRQEWLDGFGNVIEADEPSATSSIQGTGAITLYEGQSQEECFPIGCTTLYDSGSVSVTVFGENFSASYDQYDSGASSIAAQLNSSGIVTATQSGDSIYVTAIAPGANSQITGSCQSEYPQYFNCLNPSVSGITGGTGGLSNSPLITNYTYDAGGRITSVVQGAETRTFSYDGLGRKISETTPEGGNVTYSYYTAGGSLCSGDPSGICYRIDARGVVSTYTYDHANRLTGVAYTIPSGKNIALMPNVCTTTPNGTPANVCNYYDQGGAAAYANGRLTEMVDPTGSDTYRHDADGRVTQLSKIVNGKTYNIGYQYDAGGDLTQITYPSGRVVQQAYNVVGQLCEIAPSATGCTGSTYYASGFSYNAPGKLLGFNYGNGVAATFTYSVPRIQLSSLAYTRGSSTYFSLNYWYQQNSSNCPKGMTGNNGAIQCITDLASSGRSASYNYDPLGRITAEQTTGSSAFPQWSLTQTYDRFGNRQSQNVMAGSGPSSSLSFNNNNQPNGYNYDSSGNMTVEPLNPANDMTYDGENRMTAFSGGGGTATYTYDGNGLRVVKSVSGGTTTVSIFAGNSVIAEYDNGAAPSAPSREYIYNGAGDTTGLLAMISSGTTTYYHQDHLSVRLTTNSSGGIVTQEGHYPFGELWYMIGPTNKWFFTSYAQDSESGLNYALARYYNSRTSTFCSADPLAGVPDDPQSWNRYAYSRDNPIDITDPSGESWFSKILDILNIIFVQGYPPPMQMPQNNEPPEGPSGVGVWNDQWSFPDPRGLAGALGLPTMPDLGGPINNFMQSGAPNPWFGLPQFQGAIDLLKKPDCKNWLTSLAQKAWANKLRRPLSDEESQAVAGMINGIPQTLETTKTDSNLSESGPSEGGYNSNVTGNAGTNPSMTLYKGFFDQTFMGWENQIVLHEGVHVATQLNDFELAQAATGKSYSQMGEASAAWHKQLQKHCH